jgi:putative secretion ATPase (PEP-CTERM system associated)
MNYLEYGFSERAGFVLLTGDVGAGKTTLIRELINRLNQRAVIARIFNTQIDSAQLLGLINMDFGLEVNTLDKSILLNDLNDFLIGCFARDERPVLIIDEAQNLSIDVLEEIRLLSNLESENHKLLQIIMVGQPELQTILARNSLKQLRQRLSVSCHLGALNEEETREYFYHRLECAGNRTAVQFPDQNFKQIHDLCKGIPRLINIFGDYLLLTAFNDEATKLSNEYVKDIVSEIKETVAFSDSQNRFEPEILKNQTAWDPDMEGLDSHLAELMKDLDNDAILRNIIRKQIIQMDRLQDQLDAIATCLHMFEKTLDDLYRNQLGHNVKSGNLKQLLPKVN